MKKYEIILQNLEKKIINGTYKANDLLPSENELSAIYNSSRATVRQALKILEEQGLIYRRHGLGSVVIKHDKLHFPITGLVSFKELKDSIGFESTTECMIFGAITTNQELSDTTGFPVGTKVWHILRRRSIDNKFVVLDRDYIRCDVAPHLTKRTVEKSLYEYLEHKLNLDIAYAQKEITVDFLNTEDRELMDLNLQDHHVVSVKSQVYLSDNTMFQYTESRHQVDKFRFTEFARRKR